MELLIKLLNANSVVLFFKLTRKYLKLKKISGGNIKIYIIEMIKLKAGPFPMPF